MVTVAEHERWADEQFAILRRVLLIEGIAVVGFRRVLLIDDDEQDQGDNGD